MSESPVYAAPGGHVSEISIVNTLQERSMEANIEVPSLSDRDKANHFPFMKLPVGKATVAYAASINSELTLNVALTEIRLEIYLYLLIAVPSWPKDVELEENTSRGVVLAINSIGRGYKSEVECGRIGCAFIQSPGVGLTPQILRTCRAIHREAAPILYGRNVFGFSPWEMCNWWDPVLDAKEWWIKAKIFCRDIYRNPKNHRNERAFFPLRMSAFASSLQQIGKQNAATMKRLRFYQELFWAKRPGLAIEVNTLLLKYHVPDIQQIKLCYGFCRSPDQWDEFESRLFEPVKGGLKKNYILYELSNSNGHHETPQDTGLDREREVRQQEVICKAIENMIKELHWLQHLRVTGLDQFDQTRQRIEDLQTLVKNRRLANQAQSPSTCHGS